MKTKKIGRGGEITPFAMETVVDELNSDKSINGLEFERDVSLESVKILAQCLKDNDSLKTIKFFCSLPNYDIGDQIITELSRVLKANNTL
jgi:hypothetical protein